ncbi:hypothetical protein B0T09DRAFT_344420 [Sordaria sp. MPI-SDFR-AT-0083]|nr:hypothetical protein B0T09DRAFT_344420 [Sordaria sp. MPI-SDFR-AT-0083]
MRSLYLRTWLLCVNAVVARVADSAVNTPGYGRRITEGKKKKKATFKRLIPLSAGSQAQSMKFLCRDGKGVCARVALQDKRPVS